MRGLISQNGQAVRLFFLVYEKCLENPRDYNARADLMWTATLALNGLTGARLGKVGFPMHMIEHSLSVLYNIPHGAGLSIVIPGWLKWQARQDETKIIQLGTRIFKQKNRKTGTTAEQTIALLEKWFNSVKSPLRLADYAIPADDIPAIAENAMQLAKVWRLDEYSQATIEEILTTCR